MPDAPTFRLHWLLLFALLLSPLAGLAGEISAKFMLHAGTREYPAARMQQEGFARTDRGGTPGPMALLSTLLILPLVGSLHRTGRPASLAAVATAAAG